MDNEIDIPEMFDLIESFSDDMLTIMRKRKQIDTEKMMETSRYIIHYLRDNHIELRAGIIVLLEGACALYRTMREMKQNNIDTPCPTHRLN